MCEDKTSPASYREQDLQDDARWRLVLLLDSTVSYSNLTIIVTALAVNLLPFNTALITQATVL